MDFKIENLTKDSIRQILKLMKKALELYEKEYENRTYIFKYYDGREFKFKIKNNILPHLLGIDVSGKGTWLEYIGHNKCDSYSWLKDFINAEEFIEYMIFNKGKPQIFNFGKILYKSQNFCKMSLLNNVAFIFKTFDMMPNNIGILFDDRLLSFKTVESNGVNFPKSFYIYEIPLLNCYNEGYFGGTLVPNGLIVKKNEKSIDKSYMYTRSKRRAQNITIRAFMNK